MKLQGLIVAASILSITAHANPRRLRKGEVRRHLEPEVALKEGETTTTPASKEVEPEGEYIEVSGVEETGEAGEAVVVKETAAKPPLVSASMSMAKAAAKPPLVSASMSMAKAEKTFAASREAESMPFDAKAGKPLAADGGSMRYAADEPVVTALPKAEKTAAEGGSMRLTAAGEPVMSMAKAEKTFAAVAADRESGSMPLDAKAGKPPAAEGGSMRYAADEPVVTAIPKAEKATAMSAPAEKKKRSSYLLLHNGP